MLAPEKRRCPWSRGKPEWGRGIREAFLRRAEAMVVAYVEAGFSKIHLDTSMGCSGEPAALDDEVVAERAARYADDSKLFGQQVGLAQMKESGQQLALGEIA